MRILYAEDDADVRSNVVSLIQLEYNCEVVETSGGHAAIEILQHDRAFDLILSDYNMPGGTGGELYAHVKKESIRVPFLLFSARNIVDLPEFNTFFEDFVGNGKILKPATGEELWKKIEYALDAARYQKKLSPEVVEGEFFRGCEIDLVLRLNKAPCDLYLRLAADKYVKVVHRDGINVLEVVQKYHEKDIKELFVTKDDYADLSDALVEIMSSTYKMQEDLPAERRIENLQTGYKVYKAQLQEFGISPQVVELAHAVTDSSIQLMRQTPCLEQLLKAMENNLTNLFGHSLLTSYLSYAIASQPGWGSDQTLQKLSMASFLHDILLEDEACYALETEHNPEQAKMSAEFYDHPLKIAEMVRQMKGLPPDLDHIILQHHERPDGQGFPRKMSCFDISPLAGVFIVAHECGIILTQEQKPGPEMRQIILAKFEPIYNCGNFKAAYAGLKGALAQI